MVIILSSCYKTEYIFDQDACEVDTDCVRSASCCDCDVGEYINKQYFEDVICESGCECIPKLSIGMCLENKCVAVELEDEFCDHEEQHRLGDTWNDEEEICSCMANGEVVCAKDTDRSEAKENLESYYSQIDYSCNVNSDCEIKDIHNCCGYYPTCTSKNANVNIELVNELCKTSESSGACGFPTISGCACVEGKCKNIV